MEISTEKPNNHARMIMEKLRTNRSSLRISRIPEGVQAKFIALADKEFCSDYGMLLKWLMDGVMSEDTQIILEKLALHEERLFALENKKPEQIEQKVPGRKMLDGTLRRNRNE